jgi:hypothetical protein
VSPVASSATSRRVGRRVVVVATLLCGLTLAVGAPSAAAASVPQPPLRSGTATASGSWVVLPLGQLSDPDNTFWQLLHLPAGSGSWSQVTPEGTADNGGLVAGMSGASVVAGVLPSQELTFSPLSVSSDSGSTWNPVFLPGAVAQVPDGLAIDSGGDGRELAIVGKRVLAGPSATSNWSTLVSLSTLRRLFPRCDGQRLQAVAFTPGGAPLVGVQCRHGVGLFTDAFGSWRHVGPQLGRKSGTAPTSVLRLETTGSAITALLAVVRSGHTQLVVAWQTAGEGWTTSPALTVRSGPTATSIAQSGEVAVLAGSKHGSVVEQIAPVATWTKLPPPPHATVALATSASVPWRNESGEDPLELFTSEGARFSVYELTPEGSKWVRVQSTQVPLAYGSSS